MSEKIELKATRPAPIIGVSLRQIAPHITIAMHRERPIMINPTSALDDRAEKGSRQNRGRLAPGNHSPEAPTDPGVRILIREQLDLPAEIIDAAQDFPIRLFGSRLRYVTG
jgi:hypothetical protein